MLYTSTRGGASVTFEEALLRGLAQDGGLYMPESLLPAPEGWREATSPAEVAEVVLPPLIGEASASAVARALNFEIPLVPVGDVLLLELFHGPTAAFKDVGARSLARLMEVALAESGESATVLVATSGDTGSAVADAFAGLTGLKVALLYPHGGVSPVQEEQLTVAREGVTAFAVEGTFDDCQRLVKEAFADPQLKALKLTSANSINVGRLLPQMVYYLWAIAEAGRLLGEGAPLRFVVPSGNLGNLTAGLLAAEVGPFDAAFLAATNRNDYFTRYLRSEVEEYAFSPSVPTLSNAMDVGAPSNFERLFARYGAGLKGLVASEAVDDAATLRRMKQVYEESSYLACPHTAVALEARTQRRGVAGVTDVVLATAHPAKFPEVVEEAVGVTPQAPKSLAAVASAEKQVVRVAAELSALREALLSAPGQ